MGPEDQFEPGENVMTPETYKKMHRLMCAGYEIRTKIHYARKSSNRYYSVVAFGSRVIEVKYESSICAGINRCHELAFPERKKMIIEVPEGTNIDDVELVIKKSA